MKSTPYNMYLYIFIISLNLESTRRVRKNIAHIEIATLLHVKWNEIHPKMIEILPKEEHKTKNKINENNKMKINRLTGQINTSLHKKF